MRAKILILFSVVLSISNTIGQNIENSNLILSISEDKDLNFHSYQPRLIIKANLKNQNEAKNEFPEQLMESILSAINQEWVNYNRLGGGEKARKKTQEHFDKIKTMNKDKNYFELHHKLVFDLGSVPTAIIKFFFYQENEEPLSASYVLQKQNNRWYLTSHPSISFLAIIVMRLKTEVLEGIVLGNSENEAIKAIRSRVTTNGGLDVKKLEKEFDSWYNPITDKTKIELYKDPNAW